MAASSTPVNLDSGGEDNEFDEAWLLRVEVALLAMGEVLMSGFAELPPADRRRVAVHAANPSHWARKLTARHPPAGLLERHWLSPGGDPGAARLDEIVVGAANAPRTSARLALAHPRFEPPVPGVGGATANSLRGQTVGTTHAANVMHGNNCSNFANDKRTLLPIHSSFLDSGGADWRVPGARRRRWPAPWQGPRGGAR